MDSTDQESPEGEANRQKHDRREAPVVAVNEVTESFLVQHVSNEIKTWNAYDHEEEHNHCNRQRYFVLELETEGN